MAEPTDTYNGGIDALDAASTGLAQARTAMVALHTAAETATAATRRAEAQADLVSEELVTVQGELIDALARIAVLEGREPPVAPEEPEEPDPTGVATWLGATINARSGGSYVQEFNAWEATKGRIGAVRTFNGGAPTTFDRCQGAAQMRGRHRVLSVKGRNLTAAYWDAFIRSIPEDRTPDGEPCITVPVWQHEPENDGGTMTPDVFRAGCHLLEQRVRASGRTDVIAGLVLMTWLERDAQNLGTSSADWFPTEHTGNFVLLLDPYDDEGRRTLEQQTAPTLALWRASGGTFWGISETGSHRQGADLAKWIRDGVAWAHSEGASFIQWFHSAVGQNARKTVNGVAYDGWWLDDPQGAAAWKALAPVVR